MGLQTLCSHQRDSNKWRNSINYFSDELFLPVSPSIGRFEVQILPLLLQPIWLSCFCKPSIYKLLFRSFISVCVCVCVFVCVCDVCLRVINGILTFSNSLKCFFYLKKFSDQGVILTILSFSKLFRMFSKLVSFFVIIWWGDSFQIFSFSKRIKNFLHFQLIRNSCLQRPF